MTSAEVNIIITAVGIQIAGLITHYFKMKSAANVREQSIKDEVTKGLRELKEFQDVSTQRLNGMLSYVIHSFPAPAWLKVARQNADGKTEFRMLEVNESYASTYGIKRLDYLGKTDLEAGWPYQVAQQFHQHDLSVWASGEPTTFHEDMGGRTVCFRKIRVKTLDGKLVGILGYALECHDHDHCPLISANHN